jgi:hypothetical protein
LYGNGFDAILGLQLARKVFGNLCRRIGSVVQDEVGTLAGQIASNLDTNA